MGLRMEFLIEQAKHQWLNVGSVLFLLILIPVRKWTRNIAFEKIKKQFIKDEYIIYEPQFSFVVEFFAPMLFGGVALELILSHEDIFVGIIMLVAIIVFSCIFFTSCIKCVITNKRFFCIPSFNFMYENKLIKLLGIVFFELNIFEISSVKVKASSIGYRGLEIETRINKKPIRLMFENMDEIQSKIEDQILLLNN